MHRPALIASVFVLTTAAMGGLALPGLNGDLGGLAEPVPTGAVLDPVLNKIAPGGYNGPGPEAVPPGWKTWADEHNQCGPLRLIFANQDLNREFSAEGGIVHAQGSFFIQFQAIGQGADEITRFSFSFGKSHPAINDNPTLNCQEALPDNPLGKGTAGAYIMFYRSDFNAEDGFFIPIETRNVPDGDYAAAVHAYTGEFPNYVEVARGWALAEVKNCAGTDAPFDYCNAAEYDDDPNVIANDFTMPWPWVLPGDGFQTNDVNGLTIEVLEPAEIRASINGMELDLEDWEPPARDRDVLPMNDEEGCPAGNAPPLCNHVVYSHGKKWLGNIEIGDIIHVETIDRNNNSVFKSLHWGVGPTGGGIPLLDPEIRFNPITALRQTITAGETFRYQVRIENVGGAEAHVDFFLDYNNREHVAAQWQDMSYDHGHPTHLHLGQGQVIETYVDVAVSEEAPTGTYPVTARLQFPKAGEYQVRTLDFDLRVQALVENTTHENEDEPEIEDSPLAGLALAVGAVGIVAVAAQRLRRRL